LRDNIFENILGRFIIFCEKKIVHILPKQYLQQLDICMLFINQ